MDDAKAAFEELRAKMGFAPYTLAPWFYCFWSRIFVAGAAWEREKCAKIAEGVSDTEFYPEVAATVAERIRAREEKIRGDN